MKYFLVNYKDIPNADDTTPSVSGDKIMTIIASLERSVKLMLDWFTDNLIKKNEGEYHVLVSTDETVQIKIGTAQRKSRKCKKLLGVKIHNKSTFDEHMRSICIKLWAKLIALNIG